MGPGLQGPQTSPARCLAHPDPAQRPSSDPLDWLWEAPSIALEVEAGMIALVVGLCLTLLGAVLGTSTVGHHLAPNLVPETSQRDPGLEAGTGLRLSHSFVSSQRSPAFLSIPLLTSGLLACEHLDWEF